MNPLRTCPLSALTLFLIPILTAQEPKAVAKTDPKAPVALKLGLAKGDAVYFKTTTNMEQNIDMGGQPMEMGNQIMQTTEVKVVDVDDKGVVTVDVKIHAVRGTMAMPMGMGDLEFDSTKKEEPADADEGGGMMPNMAGVKQALTALAGKTLRAKVAGNGELIEVTGITELVQEAQKKAGRMGAQMLGGSLNEGVIKRNIQDCFGTLPKEPTALGGTWKKQSSQAGSRGMPMLFDVTLKLERADAERAAIQATGTIAIAPKKEDAKDETKKKKEDKEGEEDEMAAVQREMMANLKVENGKVTGLAEVSRKDGMVIKSTSEMAMDLSMPGPMGGDMKIQQKSKTVTERTTADQMIPTAKKAEIKQGADPKK